MIADSDQGIARLWQAILQSPETLAEGYRSLWVGQYGKEREFYNEIRTRFNQKGDSSDFLYLLLRCVKASVRYNAEGHFNQSPDHRRRGAHPDTVATQILRTSKLLQNRVEIYHQDFRETLELVTSNDVVYLDPPYQGVSSQRDRRYRGQINFTELVTALDKLNRRGVRYILSYDGRTGGKIYGEPLPQKLELSHLEIKAGRSSQSTLLGRNDSTVESLYLSPILAQQGLPLQLQLPGF